MFGYDSAKPIATEVFTVLPERYRNAKNRFTLEGPSFDRAGRLYFTDIWNGRIFRAAPDGVVELVTEYDGLPNGLKIHKDGRIFVADRRNGLMLLDPGTGGMTSVLAGPGGDKFKGLNDLVFSRTGDLYVTDQGDTGLQDPTGRLYRWSESDGTLDCLVNTVPSPNGLVLNRSERVLYLAVTRANAVWLVPLSKDGVAKAGVFITLPCPGPDGLALDSDGNLAVTHPGLGVVWIFDRRGLPLYRVDSCAGERLINLAYGGEDNRWLYMTEPDSLSILRAKMPVSGQPMYSHH